MTCTLVNSVILICQNFQPVPSKGMDIVFWLNSKLVKETCFGRSTSSDHLSFAFFLFISSAKRSLLPQSEKTRQKTPAGLHNNSSVSQNLQRSDHVNNNERDYSMFNDDDDDDLDITEIDQALLDGKAPVSSQKTEEKDHRVTNHNDSVKTDPVSRSRRY